MPSLLGLLIKTEPARLAALAYLKWRFLGVTSMVMSFAFKAFFDGIGKPHVHLVSAVVMNALNVVLCLLLIFGNPALGIPRMGIAGAGMAGFLATYVGLFIMFAYALHPAYRTVYHPFSPAKLDPVLGWSILKLSIPGGIATIVGMVGFGLFAGIASRLDHLHPAGLVSPMCPGGEGEPVNAAATTVIVGILKLTITACLAFGTSTATLVAQSIGEKDPDKAERFGWVSVKLGLVIFGTVGLLEAAFAPQILAFVTHSDLVRHAALAPLRLMGVCTPMLATGMIVTQALFGAGNTRFVAVAEFVLHFTCLVPLAWLLGIGLGLGLNGIWVAGMIYMMLLAGIMSFKFRSGDWKKITI
jgi:MATE family multidrug resistance protein